MILVSLALATLHVFQADPGADARVRYDRAVQCAGVFSAEATLRQAIGDALAENARGKSHALVRFASGEAKRLGIPAGQYFAAFESSIQTAVAPLTGVEDLDAVRATLTRLEPTIAGCDAFGSELTSQVVVTGTSSAP